MKAGPQPWLGHVVGNPAKKVLICSPKETTGATTSNASQPKVMPVMQGKSLATCAAAIENIIKLVINITKKLKRWRDSGRLTFSNPIIEASSQLY